MLVKEFLKIYILFAAESLMSDYNIVVVESLMLVYNIVGALCSLLFCLSSMLIVMLFPTCVLQEFYALFDEHRTQTK